MKNKEIQISDIFNDEKMEGIEQAIKKYKLEQREIQLLKMGFRYNEHQLEYELSKYDVLYRVEIWKLSDYTDHKWSILMEDICYDLQMVKKQYYDDLKRHSAYKFHEKEIKQKILDLKNKYKSHLQEETNCKIGKNTNFIRETELKAKISVLIELENKLGL
jgi:hypothetical protein